MFRGSIEASMRDIVEYKDPHQRTGARCLPWERRRLACTRNNRDAHAPRTTTYGSLVKVASQMKGPGVLGLKPDNMSWVPFVLAPTG